MPNPEPPGRAGDSATYSGGTLTIDNSGGTVLATLTVTGEPYSATSFAATADPTTGGIDVTTEIPCFAAGTRIATPRGPISVEDLHAGDLVLTASGEAKPIVWIGRSRVDCRRHAKPEQVIPVRSRPSP